MSMLQWLRNKLHDFSHAGGSGDVCYDQVHCERDATERQQAQAELQRMREELDYLTRLRYIDDEHAINDQGER